MQKFVNGLLPGWYFDDNYGFSELGKIWVLWHPSVKVVILNKSLHAITCEVQLPSMQQSVIISIVYASNDRDERMELWNELVSIASSSLVMTKPWLVLGDFNQTLDPAEHSKPTSLNVDLRTRQFRDCLLDSELADLTFRGSTFTWWNKSKTNHVAKKLDRVLVNSAWLDCFPTSFAYFGEPDFSDHASCGVSLQLESQESKKPFKFFNYILQNQNFLLFVGELWFTFNVTGSEMLRVSKKLKLFKPEIKSFCRDNYSNLEKGARGTYTPSSYAEPSHEFSFCS